MSNTLNKFFKNNDVFPTPKHKIYSFCHAFEDRMKEAGLNADLRRSLMGHTIDRSNDGEGGSLEWRWNELGEIALPFDPAIVWREQGLVPSFFQRTIALPSLVLVRLKRFFCP